MTPERRAEYHRTIDMLRRCAERQSGVRTYFLTDFLTVMFPGHGVIFNEDGQMIAITFPRYKRLPAPE